MNKVKFVLLTALLLCAPGAIRASEDAMASDDKTDKTERVVVKVNTPQIKEDAKESGNKISRFFVHTVGGKIGRGLKDGASKIADAFK